MTERQELPSTNAPNYAQRVRETLMTYLGVQGDPLNRGLTLRDLIENGFATLSAGWKPGGTGVPALSPGSAIVSYEVDLTPPPTPSGFSVSAAISHVFIECGAPTYTQGHGHLRTRLYGVTHTAGTALPTFTNAIELGQFGGQVWAMPSNPSTTWRLWIKWESVDGVLSTAPAGGTNGLAVTTGQDVQLLLDALEGKIKEGQLYSALSARIDLIDGPPALIGSVAERLLSEKNARVEAILAEADARGTAITREQLVRASADSALADSITTLTANVDAKHSTAIAAVQQESLARATADMAEATQRETLAARVSNTENGVATNTASIAEEKTVRAQKDAVLAQSITTLQATVEFNKGDANEKLLAAIQQEAHARATADFAEATERNTLAARVTTTERGVANNTAAITTATGAIETEKEVRAQKDAVLAQSITTLQALVTTTNQNTTGNFAAAIQQEAQARASADSAEANARNTLAARVTTTEQGVASNAAAITTATAAIADERTARATADTALAQSVSTLQATVNQKSVALQTESEVRATADGKLFAQYTVKIDSNGYVSGYGLASTEANGIPKSEFAIRADRFYIASPSGPGITPAMPFIVQTTPTTINGVAVPAGVYMRDAFIQNGTITNAKIANLAVDDAKIASLSVDKLTSGSISVGTYIRSYNYYPTYAGWKINGNGNAEFNNVTVRGTVYATDGIFNGDISGSRGTFTGDVRGSQFTTGAMTGPAWPIYGGIGTYLGPYGLMIGNYYNGRYFFVSSNGDVYSPNFSIINGSAYFSGNLAANIVSANNIISKSATYFEQIILYPYDGGSASTSFYMDHEGIVTIVGLCNYYFSSGGGNYYFNFGVNGSIYTYATGNYNNNGGPINSFGMMTSWFPAGWHSLTTSAHHSGAYNNHKVDFLLLRSYR